MNTRRSVLTFLAVFAVLNSVDAEIIIPPPRLGPGDQYRLIFTTSQRRDATSSNIGVYNDFVQSLADASPELAALGVEWKALASTSAVDAIDNAKLTFTDADPGVPIFRVDGESFISDYETFWTLPVDASLPSLNAGQSGHKSLCEQHFFEVVFVESGRNAFSFDSSLE